MDYFKFLLWYAKIKNRHSDHAFSIGTGTYQLNVSTFVYQGVPSGPWH